MANIIERKVYGTLGKYNIEWPSKAETSNCKLNLIIIENAINISKELCRLYR